MISPLPIKILQPLWVTPVGRWRGRRLWEHVAPFEFLAGDMRFLLPISFRCDFCSVPRVPGLYEIAGDCGQEGGAGHDYCYRQGAVMFADGKYWTIPKHIGDQVLYSLMVHFQDPPDEALRRQMYLAVCIGGGSHFRKMAVLDPIIGPEASRYAKAAFGPGQISIVSPSGQNPLC